MPHDKPKPPAGSDSTDSTQPSADPMGSSADRRLLAERPSWPLPAWLATFFFIALLAIPCSVTAWVYCRLLMQYVEAQNWQETPAKILSTELVVHHGGEGDRSYEVRAEYEYTFAGVRHHGKRVQPGLRADNIGTFNEDVYRELDRHRKSGEPVTCFVDPADPSRAFLYRRMRPELIVFFTLVEMTFGLVSLVIFPGIVICSFLNERREWRFRRGQIAVVPDEPWLWREDWARGEIVSTNKLQAMIFVVLAAWLNLVSFPLWFVAPGVPAGQVPAVFAVALLAVAWLSAFFALQRWRRIRRWTFRPSQWPAILGGELVGAIESRHVENGSQPFRLTLRSLLLEPMKERSSRQTLLWQQSQTAGGMAAVREFDTVSIAVRFAVPPNQFATDDRGGSEDGHVAWRLTLDADPPAAKPIAQFELPVFRVAE